MIRSRRWYLLLGGLMVAALLFVLLFADRLTTVSPYYMDAKSSVMEGSPPYPPGPGHPLGTDQWGRDVWSRTAYGARWSLLFALLIMAGRIVVALPMAMGAAFGPRLVNWLVERLYIYTSAIPPLLIYLLLLSSPSLQTIGLWPSAIITISLLTLVEWPRLATVLKGRLQELAAEPFIEGAVAAGASPWRIFWVHLLPHLWPTLIHMVVAEMGRSLLVVAQLGVFNIWVGGGITQLFEDPRGRQYYATTTGVPEWGTLLADARRYIWSAPWIVLPPAMAFFLGVIGFNMLSQGLEGVVISPGRWRERWDRLQPRTRWGFVAVPVTALTVYYVLLPMGQAAAVTGLAARQTHALNDRDVAGYLATLGPADGAYRREQERTARALMAEDFVAAVVAPGQVTYTGSEATANWTLTLGFRDKPPVQVSREVRLVRRWGRWYDAGEAFTTLRGLHTDLEAFYDPTDPSKGAIDNRYQVHFIATAADHAYEAVAPLFPPAGAGAARPRLKLYASEQAFRQAAPGEATLSYAPGQSIRVSPAIMNGQNRRDVEHQLAWEMLKFLTATRLTSAPAAMPIMMGAYEMKLGQSTQYRIDFDQWAGAPILTLPELFQTGADALPAARLRVYAAQTALLVEFVGDRLTPQQMAAAVGKGGEPVAALAAAMGLQPEQLTAAYGEYVLRRIREASVLTMPAGRARIPVPLTDAVAARAKAGGLEARVLDMDGPRVYVLERSLSDGRSRVVIQEWVQHRSGEWEGPK